VRLDVIVLGPKPVAAVDALDPVELGRVAELQGDPDLDRDVSRPPLEMPEIDAVVKDPGQKRIGGDLLGGCRSDRATPGILQTSPGLTSVQPRLATSWLTRITTSGRRDLAVVVGPDRSLA
jgi:hypothetical protein